MCEGRSVRGRRLQPSKQGVGGGGVGVAPNRLLRPTKEWRRWSSGDGGGAGDGGGGGDAFEEQRLHGCALQPLVQKVGVLIASGTDVRAAHAAPRESIEASRCNGASAWLTFWVVTASVAASMRARRAGHSRQVRMAGG